MIKRVLRVLAAVVVIVVLAAAFYIGNVFAGMRVASTTAGERAGLGVRAPVEIVRDARYVPHVRAQNVHDLFFAQGYAEGSDRLFQMDLVRRFVYGRLAEVLGKPLLKADERSRVVDVRGIVAREWQHVAPDRRAMLQAFSDGVNAAMRTQPRPPEFRILLYSPDAWTPQDSLAVGFATVLDLTDTWNDVLARSRAWNASAKPPHAVYNAAYPLTDWKYDVPIAGRDAAQPPANATRLDSASAAMRIPERPPIGSNEWAAGGAHTRTGRALLANDPHLSLSIPGIWYLVDLQAPGFHAAGASIAGTPGIILGHNDRIAWGATNGTVAALSVFAAPASLPARYWVTERFHVRFGGDVTHRYYRAPHVFGVADSTRPGTIALVRWDAYDKPQSPVAAFLSLDGATSIRSALRALAHYPGPTQNFVLAGTDGTAAYHLAGAIPNDPAWARYEHPSRDLQHSYATIPFDRLPSVRASRDAVVFTANNKMYGAGYPYRLSATFSAPYRAYRIHQLLTAKKRYDVAYFTRMQLDTYSPAELEFARDLLRQTGALPALGARERDLLAHWDGRYDPGSRAAPVVHALRTASLASVPTFTAELDALRHGTVTHFADPPFARGTWGSLAAMTIEHQLSGLGLTLLDGVTLPGDGDNYTIHVQTPGFSQSFRAVWDVGNWDAGGIVIPSGESGEPGSGHYTDLSAAWVAGRLEPLPYSRRAVDAAARERLTLVP